MSRRLEYTRNPKFDGFDKFDYPDGIPITYSTYGLRHFDCEGQYPRYPYRSLTKLYAMAGLHRYNLLEGKNLQFHSLKSFNMRVNCGASSYYITLAACDPDSGLQQIFQVGVHEGDLGCLNVTCTIARPKPPVPTEEPSLRRHGESVFHDLSNDWLPDWPSEIAFNDKKRFHLMKESELQNNDWIRLYLELALVTDDRSLTDDDLSLFKIVQVAIEDVEPPNAQIGVKSVVLYITYKDLAKAQIGEPGDYKAIVKRVINMTTGHLTLWGEIFLNIQTESLGGEKALNNVQRSKKLKRRLGVQKLWRLSNPRWHQAYKKCGLRSSD